ncbi:MAG: SDR family NAD(P)-dependent oxidoreductase [Chitinophagia bacterium]|jgi:2-keto-3-deoxy-L-fuconate dehydrogenase
MPSSPFELASPYVIVTGGASGIGLSIVKLFQQQGGHIDVLDIQKPDAAAVTVMGLDPQNVHFHAVDITNQQEVKDIISVIAIQRGIGILINNAGIANIGNAVNTSEEDFMKVFNVNVRGAYNCMHAIIPFMEEQQEGVILNMASIAATLGITDRFAYSMSKGAILSMTLSVARDYIKKGIRCNAISPARVHTPFVDGFINKHYPGQQAEMYEKLSASQPIGRMGTPDEIATLAFYLCSKQASFITGCDYPIDGGFTRLNN